MASDSDDDSFTSIAERRNKCSEGKGKAAEKCKPATTATTAAAAAAVSAARTRPPSVADVRNHDSTVCECPVCANSMKEALTTPCGHVFCKKVRKLVVVVVLLYSSLNILFFSSPLVHTRVAQAAKHLPSM